MSDRAGRGGSAGGTPLRLGAWLAMAYFGYWLALLVDRGLAPLLGGIAHSVDFLDVSVSAFSIFVGVSYKAAPAQTALWTSLPTVASGAFLLALWWSDRRGARPPAQHADKDHPLRSVLAQWTGLWMVMQLAYQVGVFAWIGRGRFGQMLGTLAQDHPALSSRVRVALIASPLLVAAGAMCARRLLRRWPAAIFPGAGTAGRLRAPFVALLGLAVPVLALLFAPLAASWQEGFGPRIVLRVLVPAASFLVILIAAVFVPGGETDAARRAAPDYAPFSAAG